MGQTELGYLLIIASALLLMWFNYSKSQEILKLNKDLNFYRETYLKRQGSLGDYNGNPLSYNLLSFDAGKTWYAFEYDKDWNVTLLGEVEKVYPGLLTELKAWDVIGEYVRKNGPIDPDKITPEFEKTLNEAHIKINKK